MKFLKLQQGDYRFLALFDPGSELNVINKQCAEKLEKKVILGPSTRLSGIGGSIQIESWLELSLWVENRTEIEVIAAVTNQLQIPLLLGMPFMKTMKARVDFALNILELPRIGFIELVPRTANGSWIAMTELSEHELVKLDKALSMSELEGDNAVAKQLRTLLIEFRDLWESDRRGLTNLLEHKIAITTPYAIATPPRRHSLQEQEVADEELDKMLKAGVVEPSESPYVSEPVIIKKKSGDWRYCIDYRRLNRYTVPDAFPMRRIDDLIRAIKGSRWFVALDLRSGYWQIPMQQASKKYTAFRTSKGLFQFTVMPFGLSNAPANRPGRL